MAKKKEIKKELTIEEIATLLRSETGVAYEVDDDHTLMAEVDRGPRTDHGGGDDGDEWMDDHQLESVENEYEEKHKSKITRAETALEKAGIEASVQFDYGEKGHCTIYVMIQKKRK
jgi:hypothetical protein